MLFLWYHIPYHKTVTGRNYLPDALKCFIRVCKIIILSQEENAQFTLKNHKVNCESNISFHITKKHKRKYLTDKLKHIKYLAPRLSIFTIQLQRKLVN